MKWVDSRIEPRTEMFNGASVTMDLQSYFLTATGRKIYKRSIGNSSNRRIPKIVMYEMLATKAPNAGYLRNRRAHIINALSSPKSIAGIIDYLAAMGLTESETSIIDDIQGFINIGLQIELSKSGKYQLKDKIIGLEIPTQQETKEDSTIIKENIRRHLTHIGHEYLLLLDLAQSDALTKGKKNLDARNFEIMTADLFTKEIGFNGKWLGGADKPDVVVWKDKFGYIIDNKSYKEGFNIGRKNEDEICRYITEAQKMHDGFPPNNWWKCFQENEVSLLHYLFVTSYLKGSFMKNLASINHRCGIDGGAISAANLLLFAENVKSGKCSANELHTLLDNKEVTLLQTE